MIHRSKPVESLTLRVAPTSMQTGRSRRDDQAGGNQRLSWRKLKVKAQAKVILLPLAILGLLLSSVTAQAATVAVSNHPLFLLSQAVTEGAPPAKQLLKAGEVGHHGSISPHDKKTIQDSQYVVWFGESLEHNLSASLGRAPNAIALLEFDAFNRHTRRDETGKPIPNTLDAHIWLDPQNAKAITRALAVIHGHANPQYKRLYQANAKKFAARMDRAVAQVQATATRVQPYWAYHDAYQYIEDSAQLRLAGSLTPDHHLAPKASQLRRLQAQRPKPRMCLVTQSEPAAGLVSKLAPVQVSVQVEDMSAYQDFVSGWQQMAKQMRHCTLAQ